MSSHLYDNFPLNPLKKSNRTSLHEPTIKTIQNTMNPLTGSKERKRKSSPDIQKPPQHKTTVKNPKSSRSISEIFFKNHCEIIDNISPQEEFGSNETLKAASEEKAPEINEDSKKTTNIQSTPTSILDDGYESSNSTPLVSGKIILYSHSDSRIEDTALPCLLRCCLPELWVPVCNIDVVKVSSH